MKKNTKFLDFVIRWTIILIPFFMAIAPAPVNILAGFLIASFLAKKIITREPLFVKTAINLPLAFFFAVTCLSLINSIYLKDSLRGGVLRLLQYSFMFFAVASEVKDRRHLRALVFSACFGLSLVSIDGIWQVFTGNSFIRPEFTPVFNLDLVRATASFKDSNTYGIYLSAIAPLALGLTMYYYKRVKKAIFMIVSLLAMAAIILTYSRPTLLAIFIVFIFFAIAKKDRVLMVLLLIFTISSPFLLPNSVKDWAKQMEYNPLRFMCNDDRIAIYLNSFNMIKAQPIIGLGANTYMKNYKKYKEVPEYRNIVTQDTMYAHNNFLHMAAEIGLLGLVIYLWLLFKLFTGLKSVYKSLADGYLKITALSLIACLIAFQVNGLTESSLYYSRVAVIFWFLCGLGFSLKNLSDEDKKNPRG